MTRLSVRILAIAAITALGACSDSTSFKKTSSGLMYKIIPGSDAPQVKVGQIIKLHYTQKINDSVLFTSYGKMPAYAKVDSTTSAEYNPAEIFRFLHKGDSAIVVQMVDSIMKKVPMGLPPFMKKGDKMTIAFKVVDVFDSEDAAKADTEKEGASERLRQEKASVGLIEQAKKEVDSFLTANKITAQKTGQGTYVQITSQGTGAQADSGKFVSVRYTGKSLLTGKEFENNLGADKQAFTFQIGSGQVIRGWDEGLRLLKKGGKATLYIPGQLAYGPQQGPGGKTYEALMFDIELVDVADKAPAQPQMPAPPPPAGH